MEGYGSGQCLWSAKASSSAAMNIPPLAEDLIDCWRRAVNTRKKQHCKNRNPVMTMILSNEDVERVLTMPECLAALEDSYVELAEGRGLSRTRSDCLVPTGQDDAHYSLKSMDGVIPKLGIGAVRINSDIITMPK